MAWSAPSSNGYAITSYTIEVSTDQSTWSTDGSSAVSSFTSTGLTNGTTYYYRVYSTNGLGDSTMSSVVNDKAGDVPNQVTGLTGTALNDTMIRLDWTAPADNSYAITGYKIEQSADNITWTVIVADTQSTAVVHTVSSLTTLTDYYHRVSAINALGTGTVSSSVQTTTMGVPDAPTNLTGTATVNIVNSTRSDITLTWTASTPNGSAVSNYIVQVQSIDGTGTWLTLDSNVQTTTKIHSNVLNDTLFSYRVYAVNSIGTSVASSTSQVWSLPNAPTGIALVPSSDTEITVSWNTVTGLTYLLEHSADGTTFTTESSPATTPYLDSGLQMESIHYYRVSAVNTSGTSSPSPIVNVTTQHYPTPPLNLVLAPDVNNLLNIGLTWVTPSDTGTHTSEGILNYMVERSPDSSTWTSLPSNCPPATDCAYLYYDDGPLATSSTYYYRVLAENVIGSDSTNGYSSIVSYVTPTPPQAPSNLSATAHGSQNSQIRVSWQAPADTGTNPITGYKIERNVDTAGYQTLVADTQSTALYITDSGLSTGVNYEYRVYAITAAGISAQPSNLDAVVLVDATTSVVATVLGGNTIEIVPSVNVSSSVPIPEVKLIQLYMDGAFVTSQSPNTSVSVGSTTFPSMYAYPTSQASFYTVTTFTQDPGGSHASSVTSNTVSATPSSPFTGDIDWQEYRVDPDSSVPSTNDYTQSNLELDIQPVGSDVIVKYTPQNQALDSIVLGFNNVSQNLSEVIDTNANTDY